MHRPQPHEARHPRLPRNLRQARPLGYPPGVSNESFADSALVLVGHGSTLNADSAAPTYQHADELRRRGLFAQVLEAFWKQEPAICAVLRGVFAPRVFIVPLFISEGYFTEEVIPRELGFCAAGQKDFARDRKSTRLNSSHLARSRMPSSA